MRILNALMPVGLATLVVLLANPVHAQEVKPVEAPTEKVPDVEFKITPTDPEKLVDELKDTVPQSITITSSEKTAPKNYIGVASSLTLERGDVASTTEDVYPAVISKFSLNDQVAFRPNVVITDDPVINLPVSYEFGSVRDTIYPYIGGGLNIQTGSTENVSPMGTVGFDFPVDEKITTNVALNATFEDKTTLQLTTGIAYNF